MRGRTRAPELRSPHLVAAVVAPRNPENADLLEDVLRAPLGLAWVRAVPKRDVLLGCPRARPLDEPGLDLLYGRVLHIRLRDLDKFGLRGLL